MSETPEPTDDELVGRLVRMAERQRNDVDKGLTPIERMRREEEAAPVKLRENIHPPRFGLGAQHSFFSRLLGFEDRENYGLEYIENYYADKIQQWHETNGTLGLGFLEAKNKIESILDNSPLSFTSMEIAHVVSHVAWRTGNQVFYAVDLAQSKALLYLD
jgi:hypothetical protein